MDEYINNITNMVIQIISKSPPFFSVAEVATFASQVTQKSIATEKNKAYRLIGGPILPGIVITGKKVVLTKNLLKYLGLERMIDISQIVENGNNENDRKNLEYRYKKYFTKNP